MMFRNDIRRQVKEAGIDYQLKQADYRNQLKKADAVYQVFGKKKK